MICQCPKCDAKTQLDLSHIPDEGTSAKCPECKTRFWISKESFARRAIKKDGKAFCYYCNNELNNYLDCPTCGVMYPDYCIVQTSKPVKRKKRKTSAPISFSLGSQRRTRVGEPRVSAQRSPKTLLVTIIILALFAVLAVAVGVPYFNKRVQQQYFAGYFRALSGVKLAADQSFKECAAAAAATRARMGVGQGSDVQVNSDVKFRLNAAKNDVDALMKKVPTPPEKFVKSNENLNRLYGIYTKSYDLATSPAGNVQTFSDASARLEADFRQASQELKTGFPPELADAYQKALPKIKALKDF